MSNVTGQADHAKGSSASAWWAFLAARRKAVAALIVPLAGGLVAAFPHDQTVRAISAVVTALLAAGIVHQVSNASTTPGGK